MTTWQNRAKQLKQQGLTIEEVIQALEDEGYRRPSGECYTRWFIQPIIKGINSQRGYRKTGVYDLTPQERKLHDEQVKERQRQRSKRWKENNLERHRAYQKQYQQEYRDLLKGLKQA